MRIAVLMSLASPWARETAIRLSRRGHDVHVVDFAQPLDGPAYLSARDDFQSAAMSQFAESVGGVHLIQSRMRSSLRYFASAIQLRRTLRSIGAEGLLTLYGGGFALMAFLSGFRPYSVYTVGSDVLMARGITRTLGRIALNSAAIVFANGVYLAHKTRDMAPAARVAPLYLGVDVGTFAPGSPANEPVKLVCSRGFLPVYNNEYLIRALAQMPDPGVGVEVTFTSGGPLLPAARALADELLPQHLRGNVRFLGGVGRAEMAQVLRDSHVYVSVSRSDGTSVSLLEALACGLFPVLSDIPQNREWLGSEGDNCLLVPQDDPPALASALVRAVNDDRMRKRAAEFNRKMVTERASIDRCSAELSSRLEAVVSGADTFRTTAKGPIGKPGG